jgi:hypothetical protein
LTVKRLSLTAFFISLTLSVGLVSVNLPLSVDAQNSVLSQNDGEGAAKEDTEQSQSSKQNSQVVSGKATILSGNNVQCQSEINSDSLTNLGDRCSAIVPSPTFNHEVCIDCIGDLPSPYRSIVANALGLGPIRDPIAICNALEQLGTPEAIGQKLSQGGVDPQLIAYILRCLFGG